MEISIPGSAFTATLAFSIRSFSSVAFVAKVFGGGEGAVGGGGVFLGCGGGGVGWGGVGGGRLAGEVVVGLRVGEEEALQEGVEGREDVEGLGWWC